MRAIGPVVRFPSRSPAISRISHHKPTDYEQTKSYAMCRRHVSGGQFARLGG